MRYVFRVLESSIVRVASSSTILVTRIVKLWSAMSLPEIEI